MVDKKIFIGIGGCSRSGKTTLTHRIKDIAIAMDLKFKCIHQDELVLPEDKLTSINGRPDWERPDSIDIDKQSEVIEDAFSRKEVIVIEGIFIHPAFKPPPLDHFIYLNLHRDVFLNRRRYETRWGMEDEAYIEHVWNAHKNFYNDFILTSEADSSIISYMQAEEIEDDYITSLLDFS